MLRTSSAIYCTLLALVFVGAASDSLQNGIDHRCASGSCSTRSGSLLQTQRNVLAMQHGSDDNSYVLKGEGVRCHSMLKNSKWHDLGQGLTLQQCEEKCNNMPDCKFFSLRISKGACTSFGSCDRIQEIHDYETWEKPKSYVLKGERARCHPTLLLSKWNDLGRGLTLKQCSEKCNAMPDCNFFSMRSSNGACTSFQTCDRMQEINGYDTWEKPGAGGNSDTDESGDEDDADESDTGDEAGEDDDTDDTEDGTEVRPYVLEGNSKRCHVSHMRTGKWGDLGYGLSIEECQDACSEHMDCRFVSRKSTNGQCTSFTECELMQQIRDYTTWERTAGFPTPAPTPAPPPVTRKRGLGFRPGSGFQSCDDSEALGLKDSWYYTWTHMDSAQYKCSKAGKRVSAEFVPMILNCGDIVDQIWQDIEKYHKLWTSLGAKFLLGFNEPDGFHVPAQSCSPQKAAKKWLIVQQIANYFDPPLRLVSPAPISGHATAGGHNVGGAVGGGCYQGNCPWLNKFFEECRLLPGCNPDAIEYIAFHDYEGDVETTNDRLPYRIKNMAVNYPFSNGTKRQLWLTEVNAACGESGLCRNCQKTIYRNGKCNWPRGADDSLTLDEQLDFMKKAVPILEQSEDVFRYAWFGIRFLPSEFHGYCNMLPYDSADLTPNKLGEFYRTAPEASQEPFHNEH